MTVALRCFRAKVTIAGDPTEKVTKRLDRVPFDACPRYQSNIHESLEPTNTAVRPAPAPVRIVRRTIGPARTGVLARSINAA